ncbi:hypothetical protein C8R47DRAFT_1244886 [Mycena vitilis]|nr:hypothetical protein C8R47DRAFT_1244886 [Mycena vitilis]
MEPKRFCPKCRTDKEISSQHWKAKFGKDGFQITANCRKCLDQAADTMRKSRNKSEKENPENQNDASEFIGLDALPVDAFLNALSEAGDVYLFSALVDITSLLDEEEDEKADLEERHFTDKLARRIWETLDYRFIYHSKHPFKNSATTRYEYNCAQSATRQHKSKKSDTAKNRDKARFETFDCQGWLTIWAASGDNECFVRVRHQECHEKYVCIDIPEDVKKYVSEHTQMSAPQLWKEILKSHPQPDFTPKAVYNLLSRKKRVYWHRCDDEVESAKTIIKEFSAHDSMYEAEPIPMPESPEDGITALAFALPSLIRKWGGTIREVAIDSTFNTNKAGFECYALLGEVYGSGLPLGFVFLKSKNPEPGKKEQYIRCLIKHFTKVWELKMIQFGSDKEIIEINAALAELPDEIKYQLCFWHSIRIVKGRLCVLGRRPACYDANEAFSEFDWIDRLFVPVAQLDPSLRTEDRLKVAQQVIPTIKVRLGGELLPTAPARPKIRINGNLVRVGNGDTDAELEAFVDSLDDNDEDEDLEEDPDAVDRLDGPASWFEPGETSFATDRSYVFCPAPHRKQILRIFIRHFCEHPFFPDRTGKTRTAKQIRYDAVHEMYWFCHQRGLREVWGYMWSAWYCPAKYRLWARSSQPDFIGRWRTTMAVENFWRNLKHETLHHLVHPRLDQLVYLILTDVVAAFAAKMRIFDEDYRPGRPKPLTPFQKAFKARWKVLAARPLGTRQYKIDLVRWLCWCGSQKYDAYCLCKHLVQAVEPPDPVFFREVIRRRVVPLCRHRLLKPKDGFELEFGEVDGSVSDGDYVALAAMAPRGIKRKRDTDIPQPVKKMAMDRGTGEEEDPFILSSSPIPGSSSPIHEDEGSGNEEEKDELMEFLQERVNVLREAADVIESQLQTPGASSVWLKSMKRKNIGGDVAKMVADVENFAGTSKKRRTTWAQPGIKKSARYTENTQGYVKP